MLTLAGLAAAGTVDMGFTAYAVKYAVEGRRESRKAIALAQVLLTAPQVVIGSSLLADEGMDPVLLGATIWTAALTVHGIWSMSKSESNGPAEPFVFSRKDVTFAPTMVTDGDAIGAGIGAVGRF